jgi:hypothetical protein
MPPGPFFQQMKVINALKIKQAAKVCLAYRFISVFFCAALYEWTGAVDFFTHVLIL